jgi:release factor glutamine methyltransferase
MFLEVAAPSAQFAGVTLATDPGRVMTPRPTSEELVKRALERLGDGGTVADVGTGSGALAVAIAVASPSTFVWATDVSPAAVALARQNALRNGVAARVLVRRGDLLGPVSGELDLVVANLPYLPLAARDGYPELAGEPVAAVFAEGDGLGPCRRLLQQAESRLTPGGAVILQLPHGILELEPRDVVELARRVSRPHLEEVC